MRVVTMALMDGAYYLLAFTSVALAFLSHFVAPLAYVAAGCLVVMFIVLFLSIPLKLNWSSNLYGHLLRRFLSFLVFMLFVYAVSYFMVGFERADGSAPSYLDAVYFSVTSFTTVQYGEFRPLPVSRPLVCVQSLMGLIAFIPFFAAFGWLYCQNRLWPQSFEEQATPKDLELTPDLSVGGWKEVENEDTLSQAEERNRRIALIPCRGCGSTGARIDKIYDIIGRTTPLALFIAHCPCGEIAKPSTTAFMAAWRWKHASKKHRPLKPPSEMGGHSTGKLVIGRATHGNNSKVTTHDKRPEQPETEEGSRGQKTIGGDGKPAPQP
jgi:hypothetical protein